MKVLDYRDVHREVPDTNLRSDTNIQENKTYKRTFTPL